MQQERNIKVCLVGDTDVGKTTLLKRFCTRQFHPELRATVAADFEFKIVVRQKKQVRVQFWDLAGQEQFRTVSKLYLRGANWVILVVAKCLQTSISNIPLWLDIIKSSELDLSKVTILFNKIDILSVCQLQLQALQKAYGVHSILKCSAKSGEGVDEGMGRVMERLSEEEEEKAPRVRMGREERGNYYC